MYEQSACTPSKMMINVISRGPELYTLCHSVLSEVRELNGTWTLSAMAPEENCVTAQENSVWIWDFDETVSIPALVRNSPAHHVFLVGRDNLRQLYDRAGGCEISIFLKPVTRAMLSMFLVPGLSRAAAQSVRADRDDVLQCLIQTNLTLQQYDHDRTAFLARAIHDFRSPLTALSGYCGMLLTEPLGGLNDIQKEVIRRMHNSTKRLSRMAEGMFELSVCRQIRKTPELRPNDIRECVHQALHEISPFADEKRISIFSDIMPCERLCFEAGQMIQVLINILDNACKFTPAGGLIEVRGYPCFWDRRHCDAEPLLAPERRSATDDSPNSYRVDISDSGSKIPAQLLGHIFEEYTSYSGGCDRSGGGLGLAICKMIITQHDGRIWAENRDSGPLFSFFLPLQRNRRGASASNVDGADNLVVTEASINGN